MGDENHLQWKGKKRIRPSSFVITIYVGSTNLYKKTNEAQQMFIEDLVLYICKGYWTFSTIKNIWLSRLILC